MRNDATSVPTKHQDTNNRPKKAVFVLVISLATALTAGSAMSTGPATETHIGTGIAFDVVATTTTAPQEAATGFDNAPNGLTDPLTHSADQMVFEEVETIANGLGPVFNAQSCTSCHQSPVTGGISQVTELRVGHTGLNGQFTNPNVPIGDGTVTISGRSLINDRAVCPSGAFPATEVQERTPPGMNTRTLRTSLNTLGDGYVEAIAGSTLLQISANQCNLPNNPICGQAILVPVLEAP